MDNSNGDRTSHNLTNQSGPQAEDRLAVAEQAPEQLMDYLHHFKNSHKVEGAFSLPLNQRSCLHSLLQSDPISGRGKVCIAALS